MRTAGGAWLTVLVAAGSLGAWYAWRGGVSTLFLLLLTAFMMIQGAMLVWFGPRRITVERSWLPEYPVAGDEITMKINISCEGGLPPLWLQVDDELLAIAVNEGMVVGTGSKIFLSGFRRDYQAEYSVPGLARGIYKETALRLSWGDPFGWFKRRCSIRTEKPLIVYPSALAGSLPEALAEGGREEGEAFSPSSRLLSSAPGRLRAYMPGDPLRFIHWKYSAKKGTLLSRISEEQEAEASYLLLSTSAEDYIIPNSSSSEEPGDPFETAVSAAAFWLRREARAGDTGRARVCLGSWTGAPVPHQGYGLLDRLEPLAGLRLGTDGSAENLLKREWAGLLSQGMGVTVITGHMTPELAEGVLHLTELGVAAEIWCACGLSESASSSLMAQKLKERGAGVVDLSLFKQPLRKEDAPYVSA
ncbi:DUF58 domain-containing protein [Paenibacillus sanguinis]|uniref:DUF58 domain-containing protein n=1 Tax=Paenibacillus sanguinis TaxID=225906 RepID=UPI00036D13C7|nr:DUF58 domain-containing protein [Paenibacillus sanguinis]